MKKLIILSCGIIVFAAVYLLPTAICDFICFGLRFLQSL